MDRFLKALVVDDDETDANLTRDQLVEVGYNVLVRYDAETALEHLTAEEAKYDLLILDVKMPTLDGITLAKRLRSYNVKTPILFLSGHLENGTRKLILGMTAVDYLEKPASINQLASKAMDLIATWQVYAEIGAIKNSVEALTIAVRETMVSRSHLSAEIDRKRMREAQVYAIVEEATEPEKLYGRTRKNRFVQVIAGLLLVVISSVVGLVFYNHQGVIEVKSDIRLITVAIQSIEKKIQ